MSEAVLAGAVVERVTDVIRLLGAIEAAVERHRAEAADDRLEAFLDQLQRVTADQRAAWMARLGEVGGRDATRPLPEDTATSPGDPHPSPSPGAVLEELAGTLGRATASYVRLYTTARLLFDTATCDVAAEHLRACDEALEIINWLLPAVIGRELRESQGLDCRCACPACSIGACLCVRNSTDTALHAWSNVTPFGTRGLPPPDEPTKRLGRWSLAGLTPDRGLLLNAAPRPGSPLADIGLQAGDRILEIDSVRVDSNPQVQNAITARGPGADLQVTVERTSGEVSDVLVRRPQG